MYNQHDTTFIDGRWFCTAYQNARVVKGVTPCPFMRKSCPNGEHTCTLCWKSGHGAADCKIYQRQCQPAGVSDVHAGSYEVQYVEEEQNVADQQCYSQAPDASSLLTGGSDNAEQYEQFLESEFVSQSHEQSAADDSHEQGAVDDPSLSYVGLEPSAGLHFAESQSNELGADNDPSLWGGGNQQGETYEQHEQAVNDDYGCERPLKIMRMTVPKWPKGFKLRIWRPSIKGNTQGIQKHGFTCIFQFACAVMNHARKKGWFLYVDFCLANTLYDSFSGEGLEVCNKPDCLLFSNWWNDVFIQPYQKYFEDNMTQRNCEVAVKCLEEEIHLLRQSGYQEDFKVTFPWEFFDPPSTGHMLSLIHI